MTRALLLAALLLPCAGCLAFFPAPDPSIPSGRLEQPLDPTAATARRPTVTLTCIGVAHTEIAPLLERSGLFESVYASSDGQTTDMAMNVVLRTKFVGGLWRALGLIPGFPLPLCYRYRLTCKLFGIAGEPLGKAVRVQREVEGIAWLPILPLNLLLTILPGDLGLDLVEQQRDQARLVRELAREALHRYSRERIFVAVPVDDLIRLGARGPVARPWPWRAGGPARPLERLRDLRAPLPREVPALVAGLGHKQVHVRDACQDALARSQTLVLPELTRALARGNPAELRRRAASTIGAVHLGGDPLSWRPSMALSQVDPKQTRAAVAALGALLDDADPTIRRAGAHALGLIGAPARALLPALARAATDPDWDVARQAVFALGRLGHDAPAAIESLSDYLDPPTPELRRKLRALWDPAKNLALRAYVATSLVAATSEGALRIPITARLVQEASGRSTSRGESLRRITHTLTARAQAADWRVRRAVILALGELGDPREGRVVEAIEAAKTDPDARVRRAAAQAEQRLSAPSRSRRF